MKNNDRFLIGIVGGILILIVAAFVVTLAQPKASYKPDETPENVAHNYLLAIEQQDYQRAYNYLSSDLKGYPADLGIFVQDLQRNRWNFGYNRDHTLTIVSARNIGSLSIVTVKETIFYNNGFISSNTSTNDFTLQLKKTGNDWKVVNGEKYFWPCWSKLESYCR